MTTPQPVHAVFTPGGQPPRVRVVRHHLHPVRHVRQVLGVLHHHPLPHPRWSVRRHDWHLFRRHHLKSRGISVLQLVKPRGVQFTSFQTSRRVFYIISNLRCAFCVFSRLEVCIFVVFFKNLNVRIYIFSNLEVNYSCIFNAFSKNSIDRYCITPNKSNKMFALNYLSL